MITSNQNSKIKQVRALLGRSKERREAGAFVAEGVRLVEEAVQSDWKIQFALYDDTLSERGKLQVEGLRLKGVEVEEVAANIMKSLSDTETPQGILAVVEFTDLPIPKSPNFILIPDQVRIPGNLGTLLRSATASGVQAVLIPPETTDVFAPKVLRSGMGAHFRMPIRSMTWEEIAKFTTANRLEFYMADMDGKSCWTTDLTKPVALIIGGEAEGVSEEARKLAKHKVSIPMADETESLNAGVAGSVLMFEVLRQRINK